MVVENCIKFLKQMFNLYMGEKDVIDNNMVTSVRFFVSTESCKINFNKINCNINCV